MAQRKRWSRASFVSLLLLLAGCGTSVPVCEPQVIEATWTTHHTAGTSELWDRAWNDALADGKNRALILSRGDEALAVRINLIRSARKSIKIQTFIWTNDESGRLVMWELIKAVKQRGVRVRILADQMFSDQDPTILAFLATLDDRLEIQLYNPNAKRLAPGTLRTLGELVVNFKKVNMRMHNKLMIVDDRVAITGGRNIANEYYDRVIGLNFKDRDVLAVGPVVGEMSRSFDEFSEYAWSIAADELLDVRKVLAGGEIPRYEKGTEFWFNGLFTDLEPRVGDSAWVEQTFITPLLPVESAEFIVDRPKKNEGGSLSAGGRITERLAELVASTRRSVVIQSPYLTLSRQAIRVFKNLRKQAPDLRIAVSTNSLAATDSWPCYAASYKQKRTYIHELEFDIREFKPVPQDIDKMMEYVVLLERKPTPAECENLRKDTFELDKRLQPFQTTAEDGNERIREERRNRFTGTIPYLCLHQKSLVIDGEIAFIGSYNFDPRSGNLNTEVGLVVRSAAFAALVERDIETDMLPCNSYRIARRRVPLGLAFVNNLMHRVSEITPVDVWPIRFATSYELRDECEPVSTDHEDFYRNWRDVGSFPLLNSLSSKQLLTRLFKAVGGMLMPVL